jgi:uncharacterized repeat protein (TIGR01451 family)
VRRGRFALRYSWPVVALGLLLALSLLRDARQSYAAGTTPTHAGTIPANLTVNKVTEPANSSTEFAFLLTGTNNDNRAFSLQGGRSLALGGLNPYSTYRLREVVPAGWMQKSATCINQPSPDSFTPSEGETINCTFVNVKLGTIIVRVLTTPTDDFSTTFPFTAGGLSPATFTLINGQTQEFDNLVPGKPYNLTQNVPAEWAQMSASCSDGSSPTNIDVSAGETVTCTFSNARRGRLVVRKVTSPNPDGSATAFAFTTNGTLSPATFSLKNGESRSFENLAPRAGYQVSEQPTVNWALSSSSCSNGSVVSNIRIDPGATVTCTFTNVGTQVDLQLSKDDGGVTAEPGDTIVYTLRYRNNGTKTASNVAITEQVPAHTTFVKSADNTLAWGCPDRAPAGTICRLSIGNLTSGAAGQVTFRVKVDTTLPANLTAITNHATIGYQEASVADESDTSTPLDPAVGLTLSKDDNGAEVLPGDTIAYILRYTNNATQSVSEVQITETVPDHTTFAGPTDLWNCSIGAAAGTVCLHKLGTVAGGKFGAVDFKVKVAATLPGGVTTINNIAYIGSPSIPNVDSGTEQSEVQAAPDLTLRLDDGGGTVAPGELLRYQLFYTNDGPQTATNVYLTAAIPPHTQFVGEESSAGWACTNGACRLAIGSLFSGASGERSWTLRLDRPLPTGTTAVTAIVDIQDDGASGADQKPSNNEARQTTSIVDPAKVTATKRVALVVDKNNDNVASPGDTLEYVVVIQNQRGLPVRSVIFTDTLPATLELAPGLTTSQGAIVAGSGTVDRHVEVNVGTLAADSSVTIRFQTKIRLPLPSGVTAVANQGVILSTDFPQLRTDDPTTAAAADATVIAVNAKAVVGATLADLLFIDADGDNRASVGDTLIYRLTVRNQGDGGSEPLQVRVPLAENVAPVANSVTTSAGVIRAGNVASDRTIRVDIGGLAGGANVRITFQVRILPQSGFTAVQHQAFTAPENVTGTTGIPSDDPDTAANEDVTVTVLGQAVITQQALYLPVIANGQ